MMSSSVKFVLLVHITRQLGHSHTFISKHSRQVRQFHEQHKISVMQKMKHKISQHRSSLEALKREHEKELDAIKTKMRNRMKAKRREERRAKRLREKMRHVESEISTATTTTTTTPLGKEELRSTKPSSKTCELCSSRFSSWFRKRYVCEVCGFDVCGKCSHVDEENGRKRVCVVCVNTINDPLVVSVGRSGSHDLGEYEDFVSDNQV